jgi:DNA-binding transcriptional ArsR family regulator
LWTLGNKATQKVPKLRLLTATASIASTILDLQFSSINDQHTCGFMTDKARNCQVNGSTKIPKSTMSQHFKILREAGLIHSERKGVELKNSSRCPELKKKYGPMIMAILQAYANEDKESAR